MNLSRVLITGKGKSPVPPAAALFCLIFALPFAACDNPANPANPGNPGVTYTVTFDANGGNPAPAQTVSEGGKATQPTGITKEDCVLTGWYQDAEFTPPAWNFAGDTVTGDITLYAEWKEARTSIDKVGDWLDDQTGGADADNPLELVVAIDLGNMTEAGSGWKELLDALDGAEKYVKLDLSACAMTGTEFNPDTAVTDGKEYICGIILPNTAESIAAGTSSAPTFKDFDNLKTAEGAGVITIGNYAFFRHTTLESVSFPAAQTFGSNAFAYCASLESVSFPASATISSNPFSLCTALTTFTLTGSGPLSVKEDGKALVKDDTTLIAYPSASGELTMSGITSIGSSAFLSNTALTAVTLPNVQTIAGDAFYNCTNLASASFPASATISGHSFSRCTALTTFTLTGNGSLSTIEGGKALVKDDTTLIAYPSASGELTMSGITSIGSYAFHYITALTAVNLPDAQTIGSNAFILCTGLASVNIPQAASIGNYAFQGTGTADLEITLGQTAPTVGINMFTGVSSSKAVTVKVPNGASGYGSSPADTTTENWGNAFRGKGWTGDPPAYGAGTVNSNITLTIQEQAAE